MGFNDEKRKVIHCLRNGFINHEIRDEIDSKNLFATGQISASEVEAIITRCKGDAHTSSPHHMDGSITVNVIKTQYNGIDWYIKWYYLEPNSVFISVHER